MATKTKTAAKVKKTPSTVKKNGKSPFVLTPGTYRGYPTMTVTRNDDEESRFRFSWNVGVKKALALKDIAAELIAWAEAEQAKKASNQ